MSYLKKILFLSLSLSILFYGCSEGNDSQKEAAEVARKEPKSLISSKELKTLLLEEPNVVLIDVRKPASYSTGHLPKALNIWRPQIQDTVGYEYGGMMASRSQLEELFSGLGIRFGDFLVMYDAKGQVDAARLWWILYCYGYTNMTLLDGGIQGWNRISGELSTSPMKLNSVTKFTFGDSENLEFYSGKDQVLASLNSNKKIVDCRSTAEYSGEQLKKGAYRAGRIPRAIHADYMNCIEVGGERDCEFKSVKELEKMYLQKGITSEDSIIIYCHSGVRSAHSVFVLTQILGFQKVKNYDGSWVEWSYYKELPIETDTVAIIN
ncbi:MAG: sulfurtransferase [Crocinitomicaceae bacterium]|nr:sulfurtransferase [Crocinitomicaceae bacterium]|tara:strand:+ start:468 stop:1433 length:966 start_codon:yes stop_codon:yes gene_type:complete